MAVCIDDVLDYLDSQRVCRKAENMESLMEMIHYAYTSHNAIDSAKIRSLFAQLRKIWEPASMDESDEMFSLVCELCMGHEVLAFSQGVCAGMVLMTEVNRLP